jgi:hypothetical protein
MDVDREFMEPGLKGRLQSAVRGVQPPADLEASIRARLRVPRRPVLRMYSLAAAASLMVITGGAYIAAYQHGYFRTSPDSQESYVRSVSSQVSSFMQVGLGDHIHCAVFRKYPKNPPSMEQMAASMGPQYAGIIPIVRENVPAEFRIILAHRCTYHGRQFVHMILGSDDRLLSVILTLKSSSDGLSEQELGPVIRKAGIQRFHIAAFDTRDHMVYVISDASEQQNGEIMRAMAPGLRDYLNKLEG